MTEITIHKLDEIDLENPSLELRRMTAALSSGFPIIFNELVDSLYPANRRRPSVAFLLWGLVCRDPHQSDLYLRCFKLFVVRSLLNRGIVLKRIFTRDTVVASILRHDSAIVDSGTEVVAPPMNTRRLLAQLLPIIHFVHQGMVLLARFIGSRALTGRPSKYPETIILVDTFIFNTTGPGGIEAGVHHDRHYGAFLSELTPAEHHELCLFPSFIGFRRYGDIYRRTRRIKNSRYLVPDDVLHASDYCFAMCCAAWNLVRPIPARTFVGFNVSKLLRDEQWKSSHRCSTPHGVLNYRYCKRLAKAGVRIRTLVDWNENQVIDKGLVLGAREFHVGCDIRGYRAGVLAPSYGIHMSPSKKEVECGVIPNTLFVFGHAYVEQVRAFVPNLNVRVAPAYRYQWIWDLQRNNAVGSKIVVFLPIQKADACALLAITANSLATILGTGYSIYVKPHPSWRLADLEAIIPNQLRPHVHCIDFPIRQILSDVRVAITNASTSALELAACGVPVIIVNATGLLPRNPLPVGYSLPWLREVMDDVELSREVVSVMSCAQHSMDPKRLQKIRQELFEPVTTLSRGILLRSC